MTTIVHDTYATASDSYIIGRTANIVGGTWAAWNTVYGTADFQIFSATGVCRAQSGDPFWFTNSTSNSGSPTTDAIEFTPYADNWLICALLNVSGATGYNVVFSPTGVYINVVANAVSTPFATLLTQSTGAILTAGDRSSHIYSASISGSGVISVSVDGTPVTFTGSSTDTTYTTGLSGWGGRSVTSSDFQVDTTSSSSAFIPVIGRGPGMALAGRSGLVGRQRRVVLESWVRSPGGVLINKHSGRLNHELSR